MTADVGDTVSRTGFRQILAHGEFRWLWLADIQGLLGDQLARVALAVLVYDRTRSGLASAAVYAATFLPALFGGVLLGPLADRAPRRRLLVAGDLIRAVLFASMALPIAPLWLVVVLLVVSVTVSGPWKAAESALVADVLDGEDFTLSSGLRTATLQAAQLIGFGAGGLVIALIGARPALAVDAVTFLVSATLIRLGVRHRPAAHDATTEAAAGWFTGARTVLSSPRLRALLGLSWLIGLLVVPEGLAAPYAAELGDGASAVGLLLAAGPAGVLVGSLLFARALSPSLRHASMLPLAIGAGLPLLGCAARPGLALTLVLWFASGLCLAYQVQVVTEFMSVVPAAVRGQGIATASSGLLAAQGLGILLGGVAAQVLSAGSAVALAGLVASVLAAVVAGQLVAARRAPTG